MTISAVSSSNGSRDRAREAQHLVALAAGALEQLADRLEVEALGLQLADQLDAREVLGPVVAGATADLGRRQQPAALVGAEVAHGHARALGELVDRQLVVLVCVLTRNTIDTPRFM